MPTVVGYNFTRTKGRSVANSLRAYRNEWNGNGNSNIDAYIECDHASGYALNATHFSGVKSKISIPLLMTAQHR